MKKSMTKLMKTSSWGLFKSIQCFVEFANIGGKLRIIKTMGLSHEYLFVKVTIQKHILNV